MSAGRRRMWWMQQNHREAIGIKQDKKEEDEDGRFESEGRERRVPSKGYAEGSDRTEI
jgi:hypothetical protein|tara:strand:- start:933 stop:1106 length:174 start_codon:yes stop_codon:yes gene_type:complete